MRVLLVVAWAAVAWAIPKGKACFDGDAQGRFTRTYQSDNDVQTDDNGDAVTWCDRRVHTSCYTGCELCVGETQGKCQNYWPTNSSSGCLKCKKGYFNSTTPLLSACTQCHVACQSCTSYGPYWHANGCLNAEGYKYANATYMDPDTRETHTDLQSVIADTPSDAYNLAGCHQNQYLDANLTCRDCNMSLTCPAGQMPVCGWRFNGCRGGAGVKLIGRDGEAKQCYDQNAWPWLSSYVADRDKKFTKDYGTSDWELYQQFHPLDTYSMGKGTDYAGWCDADGNFIGGPSNGSPGTKGTGSKSSSTKGARRDDMSDDEALQEYYGTHGSCDDCFPCYPQVEPDTPHCVCNWGFYDADASTEDGDTVKCVAGSSDQYIPYTKIFQNGQSRASFTIQPCEGGSCNAAGVTITLVALRELRADGSVIYDVQYPNRYDQLERHDEDGSIYVEQPTSKKYRGKSSAVPNRFGSKGTADWTHDYPGRPKNYCSCRHTVEHDEMDDIDFRVNDVTYEDLESPSGSGRINYIDWQVSPNGYRGFDARIASLIIDQDELDYSFGFEGEAPDGTVYFFSPATSFAFSTVVFDEDAAFCLDPNEILGCNDYVSASPSDVQGCQGQSLGASCGGSYAWYIDFNFSTIVESGESYNATDKVLTDTGLTYWGPAENFQPDPDGGASIDNCDHRLDQRNPINWAEPDAGLVAYVTSCWYWGTTGNVTLNKQSKCTSDLGRKQVAAICLYVPGTSGWCGCIRETHVMKRGSFKFAIEAHNYTYSVNGDSFEVEFTIEPITEPPKGVFYPGYVLPSWGGLINGVQGEQSFLIPSPDGLGNEEVTSGNLTDLITLPPWLTARYNSWNPDNSTSLDGAPTYNYTDYPDGDYRLGSSGTLRLSRFYSDDNTLHWQTFPPGYTFAGYADPNCTGNPLLTVKIRFPRPQMTNYTDPNTPIDYIWDPVMHFGSTASIPTNRPVYDPKAPAYEGRAYLGNKYASDRTVVRPSSAALSAGGIVGIVVAGAVVALLVVVAVVLTLKKGVSQGSLKTAPAINAPTNTNDLIHI